MHYAAPVTKSFERAGELTNSALTFRDPIIIVAPNNFLGITYSHISFYIKQEI